MSKIHKISLSGNLDSIKKVCEDEFGLSAYIVQKNDYEKAQYVRELTYNHSLYFLVGQTPVKVKDNGEETIVIKPTVYVGMTSDQPAFARLVQHKKSTTEKYRDWWTHAIIFTNEAWESEAGDYRMKYLEEVFWLLMDKITYIDCNGREPWKEKHEDYIKDPNKYIDTITRIANILSFESCVAFNKALKKKHDDEVKKINSNKQLSKAEKAKRLKEQSELYGWVIEVITPNNVVKHIVDDLFDNVILPSISQLSTGEKIKRLESLKFLDIACKADCEFLEYIAIRLSKELVILGAFKNETIANRHILNDQLYGLTVKAQTLQLARYNLFPGANNQQAEHIQYIDDYIRKITNHETYNDNTNKDSGHTKLYREVLGVKILDNDVQGIFNKINEGVTMKFDVVIGNPPYNDNVNRSNGGGGNNLYLHFMKKANELSNRYSCLIVPSNWMIQYPQGVPHNIVKEIRKQTAKMIEIHDFKDATQVFRDEVSIPGGVCYYVLDKEKKTLDTDYYEHTTLDNYVKQNRVLLQEISENTGNQEDKKEYIIIRDGKAIQILESIKKVTGKSLGGFNRTYVGAKHHFDDADKIMVSNWDEYSIVPIGDFTIEYYLKAGNKAHKSRLVDEIDCCIPSMGRAYVAIDQIPKNCEDYKRHKLLVGQAFTAGNPQVIDIPFYAGNNSICSQSYIPIFSKSNTKEECLIIKRYMMTKFFRYLVSILKSDQNLPSLVYKFIPEQNFDPSRTNWDIDWSKPIPDIDQQLYRKYNLDTLVVDQATGQTAAQYIEQQIKAME